MQGIPDKEFVQQENFPINLLELLSAAFHKNTPGAVRKFTVTHILRGSPPSLSSLHPARQEPVETLASYIALAHAEVSFQPSAITDVRLHVKKGHVNKVSIQTGAAEETSGHSRLCLLLPCLPGGLTGSWQFSIFIHSLRRADPPLPALGEPPISELCSHWQDSGLHPHIHEPGRKNVVVHLGLI